MTNQDENHDDLYSIVHDSKTIKINSKDVKNQPKEVLEIMVKHLLGVTEHLAYQLRKEKRKQK